MRTSLPICFAVLTGCPSHTTPTSPSSPPTALPPSPTPPDILATPADFADIGPDATRSAALFREIGKVILHPRCANCHPPDDVPRQGIDQIPHDPPVQRGADDRGLPALRCEGCHGERNLDHARVPGAPGWHLAPRQMAWLGRSLPEICAQLGDPDRNGGRSPTEIAHHLEHDALVAWAWAPGADRRPAPGSASALGALFRAWIDTGAVCPTEEAP